MSGPTLTHALSARFETIRQSELARLDKKLRGLADADRRVVEAITADLIGALVRVPREKIDGDTPAWALDALVDLFALGPR